MISVALLAVAAIGIGGVGTAADHGHALAAVLLAMGAATCAFVAGVVTSR